jgi:hypothetical protein
MHGATSNKRNPLATALLEVTRPMMIVAALYARRPCLMARPEWSATFFCIPNDHHPPSHRSALAYLLDALAQIPALYDEHDTLLSRQSAISHSQTTSNTSRRDESTPIRSLVDRSLSLWNDIYSQNAYWTASNPGFEFFSTSTNFVASTPPYPYEDKIYFSSLQAANVFTFYNAIAILINQHIVSSLSLLPSSEANILAQEAASEQISAAITQIIKSIDYHLPFTLPSDDFSQSSQTPMAGASGPSNFYLLFPIRAAHRVLSESQDPQDIAKKLWLEDVICTIKDRAGTWMSNDNIFKLRKSQKTYVEKNWE